MTAYFILHPAGTTGPFLWLVNLIVLCVVAVILWLLLQWVAGEFGVPPRIIKLLGLLMFLLLFLSLFVGCADVGRVVDSGLRAYYAQPQPAVYNPNIKPNETQP